MASSKKVLRIKVSLKGASPPIWRRILVDGEVSLQTFHQTLQFSMGWTDSHLHQFMKGQTLYGEPDSDMSAVRDEAKAKLNRVLRKPKDRMLYEYDFGDGWLHDVVLEAVLDADPGGKYPWILAGKRACPPEDCGGLYGYYRLLEVLGDANDPGREEATDWLGEGFDPAAFDIEGMNRMLHIR